MKIPGWLFGVLTILLLGNSIRTYGQSEGITSRIYFPGSIGLNVPFGNPKINLQNGVILITALEYRPLPGNALFLRFNYDAVHNHYQQVFNNLPTNVNTGKLSSSIFSLGIGYRRQAGIVKLFGILQPGLGVNNYDRVKFDPETISVDQIIRKHFAFKLTAGAEYYLAEHFALTIETSYFYLSPLASYKLLNPQSLNLSIGFTTTLF